MKPNHILALISRIREKANRFIVNELERRGIEGLVPSHGSILVELLKHHELPMKDLASMIDKKKNTVTTLVDKLIKIGYIEKRSCDQDRRVSLISLTPKGRALRPDFEAISERLNDKVYVDVNEEEKEVIINTLLQINKNLG